MKKLLGFWRRHPAPARLSAFAAGQAPDADAIERHAAGCERCRDRIAGLRAVRAMLISLPDEAPARSFRLTPAAVQSTRPAAAAPSLPSRMMPALAAMALVAFAVLVGVDLFARPGEGQHALTSAATTQEFAAAPTSPGQASSGADKSSSGTPAAANGAGAPAPGATPAAGQGYLPFTGTSGPGSASAPVTGQPNAPAPVAPGETPGAAGALDRAAPAPAATPAARDQTQAVRAHNGGDAGTIWLRIGEAIAAAVALGAGLAAWRGFARRREGQT